MSSRLTRWLLTLACLASCGASWYVSPTGHSLAHGTQENPWDLPTAIGHNGKVPGAIVSGDVINLLGGTYRYGSLNSRLVNVTLRSHPGEWAKIELAGGWGVPTFQVLGSNATYRDFELYSLPLSRQSNDTGSATPTLGLGNWQMGGPGTRLINLVVHDLAGFGHGTPGGDVYGCIVFNIGWIGGDRFHGHACYTQNGTALKVVENNVLWGAYGVGIHHYASQNVAGKLDSVMFLGNTVFNNGGVSQGHRFGDGRDVLVGGDTPARFITYSRNRTYQSGRVGYADLGYTKPNGSLNAKDNYTVSQLRLLQDWSPLTMAGNEQAGTGATGTRVFIEPNKHERGRAHVTIYNWDRKPAIDVDLSSLGDAECEIRNVVQLGSIVAHGKGVVSIPMVETRTATAIGQSGSLLMDNRFGCFLVTSGTRLPDVPPDVPVPKPDPPQPKPQPQPEPIPTPTPVPVPVGWFLDGTTLLKDGQQFATNVVKFVVDPTHVHTLENSRIGTVTVPTYFRREHSGGNPVAMNYVRDFAVTPQEVFVLQNNGLLFRFRNGRNQGLVTTGVKSLAVDGNGKVTWVR